jgi:hypothetical protein
LGEPLYYEGEVTHFSYWNADLAYEVVLYESCVNDEDGNPYPSVQVQASGVEYSGTASAQTGADGNFTLGVRPNSRAVLQASLNGKVSPLRPIARTAVDFVEVACLTLPRTPTTPGTGRPSDAGMAPVVVRDPEPQQVLEEQSAVFRAYAMGSPVLKYRWQRNGADVANGDGRHHIVSTGGSSMLFVDRAALQDNGAVYSVKVSNRLGSATSQSAVLNVRTEGRAPFVLTPPDPVSLVAGQRASFAVVAGGSPTLQYQWLRDGVEITGAQGTQYMTQALSPADDGSSYAVRVANPYGQTTSPAALVRVSQTATAPTLVREPQDTAVYVGSSATFSVVAQGTGPLLYQWQRDGSDIAGANMPDLTLHDAGLRDNGSTVRVVVRNDAGMATSRSARLTVAAAPNDAFESRIVDLLDAWSGLNLAVGGSFGQLDAQLNVTAEPCQSGIGSVNFDGTPLVAGQRVAAGSRVVEASFDSCATPFGIWLSGKARTTAQFAAQSDLNVSLTGTLGGLRVSLGGAPHEQPILDSTAAGSFEAIDIGSAVAGTTTRQRELKRVGQGASLINNMTGRTIQVLGGAWVISSEDTGQQRESPVRQSVRYHQVRLATEGAEYVLEGEFVLDFTGTQAPASGEVTVTSAGRTVALARRSLAGRGLWVLERR